MSDHIIFSFALIALFFLFLLVKKYKKWKINKNERLYRLSMQVAAINRLNFSVTDHFQHKTLALDKLKNKMLYIDLRNDVIQVVDLNDIGDFKLIRKQVSIQLELNYLDQAKDPLTITFYNKFRDYKWMRNELEKKAVYWEELMSRVLSKKYGSVKCLDIKDFE